MSGSGKGVGRIHRVRAPLAHGYLRGIFWRLVPKYLPNNVEFPSEYCNIGAHAARHFHRNEYYLWVRVRGYDWYIWISVGLNALEGYASPPASKPYPRPKPSLQ